MSHGADADDDRDHHHHHASANPVKKMVAKIRGSHHHHSYSHSSSSSPNSRDHQNHHHHSDGEKASRRLHFPHHRKDRRSSDQETTAHVSLDLWTAAYDYLKNDSGTQGLVLAYEAIIIQELPHERKVGRDQIPSERRWEFMHSIALSGLKKGLSSKSGDVDHSARDIIMFARETVESLLESYPSAALAWAGICILTPLSLDPLLRRPDMKDGLIYLTSNISRFMAFAQALLQGSWATEENFKDRRDHTRHTLLDLYRKILEFEMNCICAGASSWNMAAKNVVDWNGWRAMADAVREADEQLQEDIEKYGTNGARERLRRYSDEAVTVVN